MEKTTTVPGVEIDLVGGADQSFLRVKESLTRIGIKTDNQILQQSCFILQKRHRFYVMSQAAMEALDNNQTVIPNYDAELQCHVTALLNRWGLVSPVKPLPIPRKTNSFGLTIIKYAEKEDWTLIAGYHIGVIKP